MSKSIQSVNCFKTSSSAVLIRLGGFLLSATPPLLLWISQFFLLCISVSPPPVAIAALSVSELSPSRQCSRDLSVWQWPSHWIQTGNKPAVLLFAGEYSAASRLPNKTCTMLCFYIKIRVMLLAQTAHFHAKQESNCTVALKARNQKVISAASRKTHKNLHLHTMIYARGNKDGTGCQRLSIKCY